MPYLFVTGKAE